MPIFERAHAFQVKTGALEALPVDTRLMFDAIGIQLNCSAIVDGLINNWRNLLYDSWYDFQNLTILSFHNSAGAVTCDEQHNDGGKCDHPSLPAHNGPRALHSRDVHH
jgi:hypothetical protein